MKYISLFVALFSSTSQALSLPSIDRRQVNSAIANSAYRRRGYASTAVLDGWLYIDGGEFSYASGNNVIYQYSSTLLSIDLSQDWTNSSVALRSNSKPEGVPNLVSAGGIWVDEVNHRLFTGFGGRQSTFGDGAYQDFGLWSFAPDGQGGGRWTNMNDTAPTEFGENRPFHALVTSGNGRGYMLGGLAPNATARDVRNNAWNISGLVTYDFAANTLTNTSVTGIENGGVVQMGGAHFVPNFGPQGIMVTFGGTQTRGGDNFLDSTTVQVFDPTSGTWYEQPTSGNIPNARKEFCMTGAASNSETYEILVYAGWGGNLGPRAIPYDEVFVLSLPSFNWFKADYLAENPRHAVSCQHIGGGQIVTIGGLNTTQNGPDNLYQDVFNTPDQFTQGLSVFDLSTMTFRQSYSAAQIDYTPAEAIQQYYATNARTPQFSSSGLGDLMAIQNFTDAAVETPNDPPGDNSGAGGSDSDSGSSSNAGAIAGGVVGGIAALAAIGIVIFFFMRRKKQRAGTSADNAQEVHNQPSKYEMADTSNAGTAMANNVVYAKHGPLPPSAQPTPTQGPQYELSANEGRRHNFHEIPVDKSTTLSD